MDEGEPGAIPAVKHVDLPVQLPPPSARKKMKEEQQQENSSSIRPISPLPFDETIKVNQLKELDDIMAQLRDTGPANKKSSKLNKAKKADTTDNYNTNAATTSKPDNHLLLPPKKPTTNNDPSNKKETTTTTPLVVPSGRITPLSAPPERLCLDHHEQHVVTPKMQLGGRVSPYSAPGISSSSAAHHPQPPVSEIPISPILRYPAGVNTNNNNTGEGNNADQRMYQYPLVSDVTSDTGEMMMNSMQYPVAFATSPTPKMVNTFSGAFPHQQSFPLEAASGGERGGCILPLDISPSNSYQDDNNNSNNNDDNWTDTDYASEDEAAAINATTSFSNLYHPQDNKKSAGTVSSSAEEQVGGTESSLDSKGKPNNNDSVSFAATHEVDCGPICLADAAKMAEAFYTSVERSITAANHEKLLSSTTEAPPIHNTETMKAANLRMNNKNDETPPPPPPADTTTAAAAEPPTLEEIEQMQEDAEEEQSGVNEIVEQELGKDAQHISIIPPAPYSSSKSSSSSPPIVSSPQVLKPALSLLVLTEVEVSRENAVPTVSYSEVDPTLLEEQAPAPVLRNPDYTTDNNTFEGSTGSYTISSVEYTMQGSISGDSTNTSTPGGRPLTPDPRIVVDDIPSDPLSDAILKGASVGAALLGIDTDPKPTPMMVRGRSIEFEDVQEMQGNLETLNIVSRDNTKATTAKEEGMSVSSRSDENFPDEYDEETMEPPSLSRRSSTAVAPTTTKKKSLVRTPEAAADHDTDKTKSKRRKRFGLILAVLVLLIGVIIVIVAVTSKPSANNNNSAAANFVPLGGSTSQSPTSASPPSSVPVAPPTTVNGSPNVVVVVPDEQPDDETVSEDEEPTTTTPSPTAAAASSPTTNQPTLLPPPRATLLENLFQSISYANVQDEDSPEGKAMAFMIQEDNDTTTIVDDDTSRLIQRYALMTLYYQGGDDDTTTNSNSRRTQRQRQLNWADDSNWASSSSGDECTWTGIICEDQEVVRIDMADNGVSGQLSPDLALLTSLRTLVLNGNELEGTVPKSFRNLVNLRVLALRDQKNNSFGGSFSELMDSSLSYLENLRVLDLGGNGFTGTLPSSLYASSSILTYLDLGNNNGITGTISPDISQMESLRFLNVTNNNLTGSLPQGITDLTSLEVLDVSANQLTGPIPELLGDLENLNTLIVRDNQLNGAIPTMLGFLTALETLNLERNGFTGRIPSTLASLTNLRSLSLGGNDFLWSVFPDYIYEFTNLNTLHLENSMMFGSLSGDGIAQWSETLTSLRLDNNFLNETLPDQIGSLQKLQELRLDGNYFFGPLPEELGSLEQLTDLRLNFNQFSGELPSSLGNLGELQRLSVGGNYLSGSLPDSLTSLSKLSFFSCEDAFFEGPIPEQIGDMVSLEVFRCHLNRWEGENRGLSGSIPNSITKLENLRTFIVFQNSLDGTIPNDLPESLEILDLELNLLGGPVPDTMGSLDQLRVLRLGGNVNLLEVPESICELVLTDTSSTSANLEVYRAGCSQECTCCTQLCGARDVMEL